MIAQKIISIVIPVYFNQGSLPVLRDSLPVFEAELAARQMALELIFVDDGSGDRSFAELLRIRQQRPGTKLIKLARNFGAVAASKTGFRFVTGDCFLVLAADLQDPLEQVLAMVDCWLQGDRFVISIRAGREDPVATRLFAGAYYWLVRRVISGNFPRGGFDLMLMDRSLLDFMANSNKQTNPAVYAHWLGFTPHVLTYRRRKREYGKSRWTFLKKLRYMLDTFTAFTAVPLQVFTVTGALVAVLSMSYGLYIFIHSLIFGSTQPGFPTLVVLISFFSGMILASLSIIGLYLWRLFDMVGKTPESVIESTYL